LAAAVQKTGALRICLDLRPLHTVLRKERQQLRVIEYTLPELSDTRLFSTVDLKSGYWECVLAPESSALTTFATLYGRYHWYRLPFGLSALIFKIFEIFQEHLHRALENLDILICGKGL